MHSLKFDRSALALLLALSVGIAGCSGDDDPTGGGDELDQAEAEEVLAALIEVGGLSAIFGSFAGGAGPAAVPFNYTLSTTVPCPANGNMQLSGSASGDTDSSIDVDWTLTYNDCATSAGWVFNSSGLTNQWALDWGETSYSLSGSQTGSVQWSRTSGGRQGTCSINLTYEADFSYTQTSYSLSVSSGGTICGFEVDHSESLSGSY